MIEEILSTPMKRYIARKYAELIESAVVVWEETKEMIEAGDDDDWSGYDTINIAAKKNWDIEDAEIFMDNLELFIIRKIPDRFKEMWLITIESDKVSSDNSIYTEYVVTIDWKLRKYECPFDELLRYTELRQVYDDESDEESDEE
jgi:hypothetical protein